MVRASVSPAPQPEALVLTPFATAAEAIRFAVEDFPAIRTLGAWMRVGDVRFNSDDIQRLYDSNGYPRRRRMRKSG